MSLLCTFSTTLKTPHHESAEAKRRPKASFAGSFFPCRLPLHGVEAACVFTAYPDMAVEMAASESPTTIEDGFGLAIHSGELPDSTLVARRFAQTMVYMLPAISR